MRQLSIAMLSVHSCPLGKLGARDTGGMSVYIQEISQELGRQGHSVDVYTRMHDPEDPQIIKLGQNARLIHLKAGEEEVQKLSLYSYLPDFTCNLEHFCKNNNLKYDLVFSHYWLSGWVGENLRQRWHVPHIIMFHTLGAIKNSISIGKDESELRIVTERDLAKNCNHIIATTEREKEEFILRYGVFSEKISVIPCGVNLEMFQPVNKEIARQKLGLVDEKIVLFVGRIDPLKGIEQLIKTIPYLQNIQMLKLLIIGGDEYSQQEMEKLKKLSHELHIQDLIEFRGLIKHEQLPYFYSAADVCVVPSYYESFGLVALESLACGTPVVATNVGNLKNIIRQGETGYVITDNAPEHLADKIAFFISGSGKDSKLVLSTRASVERFGWPNITDTIIGTLEQLVANQMDSVA